MVRLKLLGRTDLRGSEGEEIRPILAQPKRLALLAFLALESSSGFLRRDRLLGLFWPELEQERARAALRQSLHFLRTSLPESGILKTLSGDGVALNGESCWCDAVAFQAAVRSANWKEALHLYRGDLLEGLFLAGCRAFEEWLDGERKRLREEAADAAWARAHELIRTGALSEAERTAQRAMALLPTDESSVRSIIAALARGGDRAAAIGLFEKFDSLLADTLHLAPSAETMLLLEAIRAEDFSLSQDLSVIPTDFRRSGESPTVPPFLPTGIGPSDEAIHPPFVAREREMDILDGWLTEAMTGRGRVGFITGEPGTGKTALALEFSGRSARRQADLIVASGNCNAHTGPGDPYRPFREILAQLTGDVEAQWAAGSVSTDHATRLWSVLPNTTQALVESGPDLLGTFLPEVGLLRRVEAHLSVTQSRLAELRRLVERQRDPGNLRQADLFQQYIRVLRSLAANRPLLLLVDDLQWADDGSIRLLFDLGHHLAGASILVLGLFRTTELALGREGRRHPLEPVVNELSGVFGSVTLELNATPDRDFVDALIEAEPNRISTEFREQLFQQARGHALFTVELLRELREEGLLVLDEDQHWVETNTDMDWDHLPAKVEAVIAERIGRVDPELQELLSIASVEGERFTLEALARVRGTQPGCLLSTMNQELGRRHMLVAPEGIQRVGERRISVYRFRHILFQRHLYDRLNAIERAHLHEQVGEALEGIYRNKADAIVLELAQHFREANLPERAASYFFNAGRQAEASLAPAQALVHYESGLRSLLSLAPTNERDRQELRFRMAIGNMRVAVPAPGPGEAFSRARELADRVGTTTDRFWAIGGLYWVQHFEGAWEKWDSTSQGCLSLARECGDRRLLLSGLAIAAHGAYYSGDFALAISHCEEFLGIYGSQGHQTPMLPRFDLGAGVQLWLGQALFKSGHPEQGLTRILEAVSRTREAKDLISLHGLLAFGSGVLIQAGDYAAGRRWAEESLQVQAEAGEFGHVGTYPLACRGWCDVMLGRFEEGLKALCEAVDAWEFPIGTAYMRAQKAVALSLAGRGEEGRAALEEALAVPEWNGPHHAAQVPRLFGDLLANLPDPDLPAAEAAYQEAIDIARRQEARSDELSASICLARLLKPQGRTEEAREVLGAIYGWFTEGHGLPYLMEAKELLKELGSF